MLRYQFVLFCLLVAALAFLLQPWGKAALLVYDYSRWVEVFFLVSFTVGSFLFFKKMTLEILFKYKVFVFVFIFFVVTTSFLGESGFKGWVEGFRFVFWVLIAIILVSLSSSISSSQSIVFARSILTVCGIHLVYIFVGGVSLFVNGLVGADYLIDGFSNKNHAAAFYVVLFLLLPGLKEMACFSSAAFDALVYLASIFLAFMVLTIGSRGAIVSVLLAFSFVVFLGRGREARKYFLWILSSFSISFLLFLFLLWGHANGLGEGKLLHHNYSSDSGRFLLWREAWAGFLESPWFGRGPLSYSLNRHLHVTHPHNFLLLILYEYGVFLAVMAVALIGGFYKMLWVERGGLRRESISLSGIAGVTAFVVHSMVGAGPMIPAVVVMFVVSLVFVFFPFRDQQIRRGGFGRVDFMVAEFFTLGIVFSAIGYGFLVFEYWRELPDLGNLEPRFWQFGEISAME